MADKLTQCREDAIKRHDAALDRWWPDKGQPEYHREVLAVTRELERIVAEAESAGWSRLERSRTLRWLADAYADLSRDEKVASGEDLAWLSRAAATYSQAEPLCSQAESPRDYAVLNFNYANTLRRFDIENTALLESARRRYEIALDYFSTQEPQLAPQVRQALDSVNVLLQLAPLSQAFKKTQRRIEQLDKLIESGGGSSRQIHAELTRVMENGGPRGLLNRIVDLVSEIPESLRQRDPDGKLQALLSHALTLSCDSTEMEQDAEIMNALRARLQQEIDSGNVSGGRIDVVKDALDSLTKTMSGKGDDISAIRARMLDLRSGAEALMPAMKNMSYGLPLPEPGSRAAMVRELFWGARQYVLQALTRGGQSAGEREILYDVAKNLTELDKRLVEAREDDSLAMQIEIESIRPVIARLRDFALRNHRFLASPFWSASPIRLDSNALLFCGNSVLRKDVANWAEKAGMKLMNPPNGSGYADARWRQIGSANLLVFDLTPDKGNRQASAAYQLGIAMALGKPVVVINRSSDQLPFDIDIPAVQLNGDNAGPALEQALTAACYWIPSESSRSSVAVTIEEAKRQFSQNPGHEIQQSLKELDRLQNEDAPDPVEAGRILSTLLSFLGPSAPLLISPAWSGVYPEPGTRCLFHVMPFGPEWADAASAAAAKACQEQGVNYVRGDRVADPQIIRSIWEELCRASHILVDITGFNANVAFELGIAHTLGKKVHIVGQPEAIDDLFDMIEKHRVSVYGQESITNDLGSIVLDWLRTG